MISDKMDCRFCQREMRIVGYGEGAITTFWCDNCKSNQAWWKHENQLERFSFQVNGKYEINFFPTLKILQVWLLGRGGGTVGKELVIHNCNFVPSPQNMTVERIKTWILFS